MFQHFYHETLRRVISAFGTLFNNIYIKHKNDEGEIVSTIKVPIAYGPTQKFLARLEQSPDLSKPIQITLPRLSMEITNIKYDSSRQTTATQSFIASDQNSKARKGYLPIAYTLYLELGIFTKLEDDMFQIIEQILPYFRPSYTVSVEFLDEIKEKRDIVFTLNDIEMTDDYEGNFDKRRSLIWTLRFSADIFFFIPLTPENETSKNIINKVSFGFIAGDYNGQTKNEDVRYNVTPKATKNYTGTSVTTLSKDSNETDTIIEVTDSSSITEKTFISINDETLYVKSIQGNVLSVDRGIYDTTKKLHIKGSEVLNITTIDNTLIGPQDPFSFIGFFE
jgi:hypothetical protein